MYAIGSRENFENEVTAMLNRIGEHISSIRSKPKMNDVKPGNPTIEGINELKMKEYKLKEMFEKFQCLDEDKWEANRDQFQAEFKEISKNMIVQN
ncbi:MAG: hypothetical protein AB8F74_03040 [Saprospiraceae bacterium]